MRANSKASHAAASKEPRSSTSRHREPQQLSALMQSLKDYARKEPEMAALCCFGIGFVLGWKLKPW